MRSFARLFPIAVVTFVALGVSSVSASPVVATSRSKVVLAGGAAATMSSRRDNDDGLFLVPNVSAYFWQSTGDFQVGGGSAVHFWATEERGGGPIFTPSVGLARSFLLNPNSYVSLAATGGWLIGHYNDEWHHGVAVTFGPNITTVPKARVFGQSIHLRFGLETTLFYTGETSRSDRYQPVLSLGATIGLVFPILWTIECPQVDTL